ncbi:hypothetical protein [Clostridium grantii]|uniref:Uncharacterized protein n=1 Tax=Clostridium grantii DSM 8605 TaxID=1121316 RepID=A0A1M5XPC4_9CLOT|nr:hypothetical protein [Clostridium grantii]SHI01651.1 hypothetical protein SAMN02745207_03826 [Clostridium grantii DSM 8605]
MNKKVILSLLFIVFFSLCCYIYLTPKDIYRSYDALILSENTDLEVKSKISITGILYKKIINSDSIEAFISVDEYTYQVVLNQTSTKDYLGYISIDSSFNSSDNLVGSIKISKDLSQVWINADDLNDKYKDIYYAIAPANSKIEAEELLKKLVFKK